MKLVVVTLFFFIGVDGLARTDNVDASAYCPGCGGDSGGNQSHSCPAFTPGKYKLDATGDDTKISKNGETKDGDRTGRRIVLVAAPPDILDQANKDPKNKKCMIYADGGKTDACNNPKDPCNKAYKDHQEDIRDKMYKSIFVICDRCPGCEEKGKHRQRFDMAMSPKLATGFSGFKFQNANFKYVECPQDIADRESDQRQQKHDDAVKQRNIASTGRYKAKNRSSLQIAKGRSPASQ